MPPVLSRIPQFLAVFALVLSSCAVIGAPRRVPFNDADFAAYQGSGSGTITGQLVATSSDGETHLGDGTHITLLPVTPYTREMVDREIGFGENLLPSDPKLAPYVRMVTTGPRGEFVFSHLPPGEYFVAGLVEWYVGDDAQYQWACEKVTLGKGQTVQIKVARNLQRPGAPTLVIWALK
jgi:hypothetical protein